GCCALFLAGDRTPSAAGVRPRGRRPSPPLPSSTAPTSSLRRHCGCSVSKPCRLRKPPGPDCGSTTPAFYLTLPGTARDTSGSIRITTTCCVLGLAVLCAAETTQAAWRFTDVTAEAGLTYQHAQQPASAFREPIEVSGGVAAGDYDGDGWVDLYVVRGD